MKNTMKKVLCTVLVIIICLTSTPLSGFVGLSLPNFADWFSAKANAVNYNDYFASGIVDPSTQVIIKFDLNGGTIKHPCRIYDKENHQFIIVDGEDVPDPYIMLPMDLTTQLVGQYVTLPHLNTKGGYRFEGWFCYRDGYTYPAGGEYKIPYGTAGTIIEFYARFVLEDPNYVDPKDKHTEGDYTYTLTDDKATIIDVDTSISGDVVIPSTLGGYPVTAIGYRAFAESFNITSVVIPEGVTYIDEDAFAFCFRMESVTLPESLETIENWVFGACLSLKEIVLPESVVSINDSAFDSCLSLEKIVVKNAETAIGEYIGYTTLLPKDVSTSEWVEKCITAYEADMNGDEKAEELEEELRLHTEFAEEAFIIPSLTMYGFDPSTAKTYADENGIPFKNISELEEPHTCTFGEWFTETEPTVFSEGVSKRVCDCGKFETNPIAKLESAVTKDETTKVEVTYTEENFESEVEIVVSEEEINANFAFGDEFESYKAYDISLEADGEKVQPNGYVTVKLPIPEGFNADSTVVYYVAPDGTKTKLDSKAENRYVVFETNHFSEYVLVDESSKIEPPHQHSYTPAVTKNPTCTEAGVKTFTCSCNDSYTESIPALGHKDTNGDYKCDNGCGYEYEKPAPEEPEDPDCSCNCHKGGFMGFIWKIINFFQKLFKTKQYCACGAKHW